MERMAFSHYDVPSVLASTKSFKKMRRPDLELADAMPSDGAKADRERRRAYEADSGVAKAKMEQLYSSSAAGGGTAGAVTGRSTRSIGVVRATGSFRGDAAMLGVKRVPPQPVGVVTRLTARNAPHVDPELAAAIAEGKAMPGEDALGDALRRREGGAHASARGGPSTARSAGSAHSSKSGKRLPGRMPGQAAAAAPAAAASAAPGSVAGSATTARTLGAATAHTVGAATTSVAGTMARQQAAHQKRGIKFDPFKTPMSEKEKWTMVHGPNHDPGWCLRRSRILWGALVWYSQIVCHVGLLYTLALAERWAELLVGVGTSVTAIVGMSFVVMKLIDRTLGPMPYDELKWSQWFTLNNSRRAACLGATCLTYPYFLSRAAYRQPGSPPDDMHTPLFTWRIGMTVYAACAAVPQLMFQATVLTLDMATKVTTGIRDDRRLVRFQLEMASTALSAFMVGTAAARLRLNGPSGRAKDDDSWTFFQTARRWAPASWSLWVYLMSLVEVAMRCGSLMLFGVAFGGGWVLAVLAAELLLKLLWALVVQPMGDMGDPRTLTGWVVDMFFWFPPSLVFLWTPVKRGRSFARQHGPYLLLQFVESWALVVLPCLPGLRPSEDSTLAHLVGEGTIAIGLCAEVTAAARCSGTIPSIWPVFVAMATAGFYLLLWFTLALDGQLPCIFCCKDRRARGLRPKFVAAEPEDTIEVAEGMEGGAELLEEEPRDLAPITQRDREIAEETGGVVVLPGT